jgi:hypothetical protein
MDPFAVNWAYCRRYQKNRLSNNHVHFGDKVSKGASKLYHTYRPRASDIAGLKKYCEDKEKQGKHAQY